MAAKVGTPVLGSWQRLSPLEKKVSKSDRDNGNPISTTLLSPCFLESLAIHLTLHWEVSQFSILHDAVQCSCNVIETIPTSMHPSSLRTHSSPHSSHFRPSARLHLRTPRALWSLSSCKYPLASLEEHGRSGRHRGTRSVNHTPCCAPFVASRKTRGFETWETCKND